MEENRFLGRVIWFNRVGHGFIQWKKDSVVQKDLFVHYSDLNMNGFRMLHKDQEVSFEIGLNHRGQPKAVKVEVINLSK